MNSLMKMGTEKEVKRLREQFLAIDTDKTGSITFAELKSAFAQIELDPEDEHVQQIINKSDFDGDHTINYTEFLSATVDLSKYLNEQKLLAVFRQFDTDNSGYLTP